MNISEMHTYLDLEIDKTGSLSYPDFLPEEKDYWLQRAELKIVKDTLFGSRTNPTTEKKDPQNREDLRTLIVEVEDGTLTVDAYRPNLYHINLTSQFLHFESATVEDNSGNLHVAKFIDKHDKNNYLSTVTNKPWVENPLVYVEEDKLSFIVDPIDTNFGENSILLKTNYSYYKQPSLVSLSGNISSDLPESLHQEVVYTAANLMLENIESPRYNTNTQVTKDTL